jgi:hypothetical protein
MRGRFWGRAGAKGDHARGDLSTRRIIGAYRFLHRQAERDRGSADHQAIHRGDRGCGSAGSGAGRCACHNACHRHVSRAGHRHGTGVSATDGGGYDCSGSDAGPSDGGARRPDTG